MVMCISKNIEYFNDKSDEGVTQQFFIEKKVVRTNNKNDNSYKKLDIK